MRRPRNFQTDRCYHLVNRVGHRAFYLDEYEPWHEVTPPLPLHQWGQTLWRSLLIITCTLQAFLCAAFDVALGDKRAELNIYAAHYAPKGYSRLGDTGYGEFLDYSFGQTNTCKNTAVNRFCGNDKFLCITNPIANRSKFFDFVTLFHDATSRRLFRITASRTFPMNMSSTDCMNLLKALSRDCDYRYKIKIPIPYHDEVDALLKNRHNGWSINCRDASFLISLSLLLKTNGLMELTMTVESLQVRRHSEAQTGAMNDIEINVNDL